MANMMGSYLKVALVLIFIHVAVAQRVPVPLGFDFTNIRELYSSTNGPYWTNSFGWNNVSDTNICSWYGVGCVDIGETFYAVGIINMTNNNVTGSFPTSSSFLQASSLFGYINLGENKLTGDVKVFADPNYQHLAFLNISSNQFYGIMPQLYWNVSLVDISNNYITGLTTNAPASNPAPVMASINYGNNLITGFIPSWLKNFAGLQQLILEGNNFEGSLPDFSTGILAELRLGNTLLNNTLDTLLPRLPSTLRSLNLTQIAMTGTINGNFATQFPILELVDLSGNLLTGPIPSMPQTLQQIVIEDNQLQGPIPDMTPCNRLLSLRMGTNNLKMNFSSLFNRLPSSLLELNVSSTQLNGIIPDSISRMSNLSSIDVSYNQVSGLPQSIGTGMFPILQRIAMAGVGLKTMPNLTSIALASISVASNPLNVSLSSIVGLVNYNTSQLNISDCQLNGPMPSLANFISLQQLDLSVNQLTSIATDFVQIQQLIVSGNLITTFPDLSAKPSLVSLIMDVNNLNATAGSIGSHLPPHVLQLSLYGCGLSGDMTAFTNTLRSLNLGRNQFTAMPSSVRTVFPNLQQLVLEENQITTLTDLSNTGLLSIRIGGNPFKGNLTSMLSLIPTVVQQLNISSCFLTGTLPSSISNYPYLAQLDLSVNQITSVVPASLVSLSYLRQLNLQVNNFYGEMIHLGSIIRLAAVNISDNSLEGNLTLFSDNSRLQLLDIKANLFTGPLDPLASLTYLRYLDVSNNIFSGTVPSSIGEYLLQLNYLSIARNSLVGGLPSNLVRIPGLLSLDVSFNLFSDALPPVWTSPLLLINFASNQLTGTIPESLFDLGPSVFALVVTGNQLTGSLSPNVSKLVNMQALYVSGNRMSGPIPDAFASLTQLKAIAMGYNQFSGEIPQSICTIPQLFQLDLSHNALNGTIPPCIGNLTPVQQLLIQNNQLTGPIPDSTKNLTNLLALDVSNNFLNGTIENLMGLVNLTTMDCSNNTFTGNIPTTISALSALKSLSMSFNKFSGDCPVDALRQIGGLQRLDVSYNQLTGGVPGYVPTLQHIDASHNQLTTMDNNVFEQTTVLQYMDISYNNIYAPVPTGAGIAAIQYLRINNNRIRGNIVAGLEMLSSLTYLDVSSNLLTGGIPFSLNQIAKLQYCNASSNQLKGSLPPLTNSLAFLTTLDISNNSLSDVLPTVSYPPALQYFSLRGNKLNGTIPSSIGALSSLQYLDLGDNYLQGSVPSTIGGCTKLDTLDLSNNQLSGTLPDGLGSLRAISTIRLSNNQLSGPVPTLRSDPLYIDMSNNQLTGSMEWLNTVTSLTYLNTSHNAFSSIGTNFNSKLKLQTIDLSSNVISDSTPDLSSCSELVYVNISGNELTGSININSGSLQSVDLSNNQIAFADGLSLPSTASCNLAGNPFQCPLPWTVYTNCRTTCSAGNSSSVSLQMRVQGDLSSFNQNQFLTNLAAACNTTTSRFDVIRTFSGSVYVDMNVLPPSASLPNQGSAQRLVDYIKGNPNSLATNGITVLNTSSPIPATPSGGSNSISKGAIAGIVIAIVAIVAIVVVLVFLAYRYHKKQLKKTAFAVQMQDIDLSKINLGAAKKSQVDYEELKDMHQIGAGAFGVVYRAHWRDILVAVKQIRAERIDEEQLKSFLMEVAILQNLRAHPNVVMFLGMTFPPQPLSMITEFCDGGCLFPYLRQNNVSWEQKLKFIQGIALGMLHLHLEKVIHRDLAVRNVLLNKHLEPKVSDFGMSREQQNTDDASKTATEVGPLKWMSPEAIQERVYSTKSDVFSFGVVCWEIITVREPWADKGPVEAAIAVTTNNERLPIPDDCDPHMARLMTDCWKREPAERPTFKEICELLGAGKVVDPADTPFAYSDLTGNHASNYGSDNKSGKSNYGEMNQESGTMDEMSNNNNYGSFNGSSPQDNYNSFSGPPTPAPKAKKVDDDDDGVGEYLSYSPQKAAEAAKNGGQGEYLSYSPKPKDNTDNYSAFSQNMNK